MIQGKRRYLPIQKCPVRTVVLMTHWASLMKAVIPMEPILLMKIWKVSPNRSAAHPLPGVWSGRYPLPPQQAAAGNGC